MLSFLKVDPQRKLKKLLGRYELPAFTRSAQQILSLLRESESRPAEIARAIAGDPALSVRIFKTVNSAAYTPRQPIRSLDQAVVMLGRSNLEQVVLSLAVKGNLPNPSCPGFDHARFWTTAATRAATARALADRLHPSTVSESFTASLLQDLAIPLLASCKTKEYGAVLQRWHDCEETLHELERETFGWDHAEVATWVGVDWGLPDSLISAIGAHHGDTSLDCPPAVVLVGHLRESRTELGVELLVADLECRHGLDRTSIDALMTESEQQGQELARLLT